MHNLRQLELSPDKQSRFWARPVPHDYKAAVTSVPLCRTVVPYLGRDILDIGAADGSLMRTLHAQFVPQAKLTGIDLAPKSPEVQKGDCTRLQFADSSFDTVFMTDVVEHLADGDLQKALNEARRVLKTGGHLIMATPNEEDLTPNVMACPHCDQSFHRWGHCQTFSKDTLSRLAEGFKFQVVFTRTFNLAVMARRPWIARIAYMTGLSQIFKRTTFHHDLVVVARKT